MRYLLDTHCLIWAADLPTKLPSSVRTAIQSPANDRIVSVASLWEIAIKIGKNNLPLSLPFRHWIEKAVVDLCLEILHVDIPHMETLLALPRHHNDPFDRMLAAQSLVESIPLLSADANFDAYGVTRIWN